MSVKSKSVERIQYGKHQQDAYHLTTGLSPAVCAGTHASGPHLLKILITEEQVNEPLSQTGLFRKPLTEELTSLPLAFHAKIYQSLDTEKAYLVKEVVYSFRQLGLSKKHDPIFLSLKMSKVFSQVTEEKTLKKYCKQLPTLGFLTTANGNCVIQSGYYPRIESGFTLSDILQKPEEVDEKYFLSAKQMESMQKSMEKSTEPSVGWAAPEIIDSLGYKKQRFGEPQIETEYAIVPKQGRYRTHLVKVRITIEEI